MRGFFVKIRITNDSTNLKTQAANLLNETKLIELLTNFGEIEITRSFKYDLMTKPDIDIHLYNMQELETTRKLIQQIIKKEKFKHSLFKTFYIKQNHIYQLVYIFN